MKTLLIRFTLFALSFGIFAGVLSRGPNYTVTWEREVPSKEPLSSLNAAFLDPGSWPVFHHALKSVTFFDHGKPIADFKQIAPGMTALFAIEPTEKPWKRFEIRAEVLAPLPGEAYRFRMQGESTGKTTRLLDGFEWWIGVRPANEAEAKRGNVSAAFGGAKAETKTARARFFGRFTPKIMMNQLYQMDLVRLANLTETREKLIREAPPKH